MLVGRPSGTHRHTHILTYIPKHMYVHTHTHTHKHHHMVQGYTCFKNLFMPVRSPSGGPAEQSILV